jgi:ribonuclease HII
MKYQYIVGIDEVGRGPVAGPVYVCGVLVECELLNEIVSRSQDPLRDSKKLTEKMRVRWFEYLKKLKQEKKFLK